MHVHTCTHTMTHAHVSSQKQAPTPLLTEQADPSLIPWRDPLSFLNGFLVTIFLCPHAEDILTTAFGKSSHNDESLVCRFDNSQKHLCSQIKVTLTESFVLCWEL